MRRARKVYVAVDKGFPKQESRLEDSYEGQPQVM